ncbi:MAG: 4Fe-4S dicluster domain-containing protein [Deltaproteobacteria bacterium]|nr:4Fe-4S dicluster domain-containing protein [Deltaproteobacteria bacterium]MBW2307755.1 4Fe-4S dicluster domain-containing protein [Deltaproteobacteria bacterium]
MERLIVFHADRCIKCHSCEIACQLENDAPPGLRFRRVKSFEEGHFPDARNYFISSACFHCNDPSCVSACPVGALLRRDDGIVVHFRNKCVGCGYCIQACPFHVPQFSPFHHTMRKCSFCSHRVDNGREPACVAKCTANALVYYPDGKVPDSINAYGKPERLHMVYELDRKPGDYQLPNPVPANVLTSTQLVKWLIGLIPGVGITLWLLKKAEGFKSNGVRDD